MFGWYIEVLKMKFNILIVLIVVLITVRLNGKVGGMMKA